MLWYEGIYVTTHEGQPAGIESPPPAAPHTTTTTSRPVPGAAVGYFGRVPWRRGTPPLTACRLVVSYSMAIRSFLLDVDSSGADATMTVVDWMSPMWQLRAGTEPAPLATLDSEHPGVACPRTDTLVLTITIPYVIAHASAVSIALLGGAYRPHSHVPVRTRHTTERWE